MNNEYYFLDSYVDLECMSYKFISITYDILFRQELEKTLKNCNIIIKGKDFKSEMFKKDMYYEFIDCNIIHHRIYNNFIVYVIKAERIINDSDIHTQRKIKIKSLLNNPVNL